MGIVATPRALFSADHGPQNRSAALAQRVAGQSAAPRVHHFHGRLLPPCHVRLHKSRTSPSRALLRREGDRPMFSTASRVKLIPGLLGSTQANDHIRPRIRQPNSFSSAVVPEGHVELIPYINDSWILFAVFRSSPRRSDNSRDATKGREH